MTRLTAISVVTRVASTPTSNVAFSPQDSSSLQLLTEQFTAQRFQSFCLALTCRQDLLQIFSDLFDGDKTESISTQQLIEVFNF